jgi:hypothetical protein
VGARPFLQDGALIFGEFDAEWALAGHLFSLFDATIAAENLTAQRRERINEIESRTTKRAPGDQEGREDPKHSKYFDLRDRGPHG